MELPGKRKKKTLLCQTKWTCNCSTLKGISQSPYLCCWKTATNEVQFPEGSSSALSGQWTRVSGSEQGRGCPRAAQGPVPRPEQAEPALPVQRAPLSAADRWLPRAPPQRAPTSAQSGWLWVGSWMNSFPPGRWVTVAVAAVVFLSPHNEGPEPPRQLAVGSEYDEGSSREMLHMNPETLCS